MTDWTLAEAAKAVSTRCITSRELVEACLDLVSAWQPVSNAFAAVDADGARFAADQVDRAVAAGKPLGRLAGVPLAHKDMYFRPGRRSAMGSRAAPPATGAPSTVLERLDAESAIELGTLNMAEFALGPTGHNTFLGDCCNPWNADHVSGGSSSGSGAAVAARTVFGSFGSDSGGSIRLPASATGVLGLKPTNGRVSCAGMMPLSSSIDVPGICARTARDVALLLGAVAGHDPRDAGTSRLPLPDYLRALESGVKGLRIGIPDNFFLDGVTSDVGRALQASLDVLASLGAVRVPVRIPAPGPLCELSRAIVYSEVAALHATWLRDHFQDYSPQVRVRAATGFAIPAPAYLQALQLRPVLLERFVRDVYARCDVLHLPTLEIPVPTRVETDVGGGEGMWAKIARMVRCTAPFNYLGLPALSVPCGFTDNGLPTSFQLVGRPFAEATLLGVAHAFESATDWHRRAPSPRA